MKKKIIPIHRIAQAIRWIRAEKVMLDFDLAACMASPRKS